MSVTDDDLRRLRAVLPGGDERYELHERIGQGGMGAVWRATDRILGRDVALKVLAAHRPDAAAEERLRREASILARLEHPGIVPVHDAGRLDDGRLYYVMKLVRGRPLDAADSPFAPGAPGAPATLAARVDLVLRIAEAVAFAHRHGVIHRDLKPSNVMVGEYGEVLVLDWGVAGLREVGSPSGDRPGADATRGTPAPTQAGPVSDSGTATGTILGTPAWMAPEQSAGLIAPDARLDVWGVGAILYWLLLGVAPNDTTGRTEDRRAARPASDDSRATTRPLPVDPGLARRDDPANIRPTGTPLARLSDRSDIPRPLRSILAACLAGPPADRYASLDDLLADLRRWREGGRVSVHRESPLERTGRLISRYRTPLLLVLSYMLIRAVIYLWGRI